MQAGQLITTLIEQTEQLTAKAKALSNYDLATLQWREHSQSWNMLECIEHLNRYGDFYLPQMQAAIQQSTAKPDAEFRSGWLGGYFAKSMLPKEKLNKMSTFKDKNPLHAKLDKNVIERFIEQQEQLVSLLKQSRKVSLNRVKIPTTLSKLIKIRLGDAFPFLINHIIRHFAQLERIEKAAQATLTRLPNI